MYSSNTIRNLKLFGASICLVIGRYPSKRKEDRVPLGRYSVDPARGISPPRETLCSSRGYPRRSLAIRDRRDHVRRSRGGRKASLTSGLCVCGARRESRHVLVNESRKLRHVKASRCPGITRNSSVFRLPLKHPRSPLDFINLRLSLKNQRGGNGSTLDYFFLFVAVIAFLLIFSYYCIYPTRIIFSLYR